MRLLVISGQDTIKVVGPSCYGRKAIVKHCQLAVGEGRHGTTLFKLGFDWRGG